MNRYLSARKILLGTLVMIAASATLLAPPALAAPGDETNSLNEFGVEMATDDCSAAWIQLTIEGAPQLPDRYSVFYKGLEPSCTIRSRFVGFAADKTTEITTDYVTTNDSGDGGFSVPEAYRCHVEFGVQRRDGSYHTEFLRPQKPEVANCPS